MEHTTARYIKSVTRITKFHETAKSLISLMMEAVRTSETSVDNHFTRQYNPEDSSEQLLTGYKHKWLINV
jgi:hypothetical protein